MNCSLLPILVGKRLKKLIPNPGGVTTPPKTQTEQRVDRLVLKKDRPDESYTRPIRIYVTSILSESLSNTTIPLSVFSPRNYPQSLKIRKTSEIRASCPCISPGRVTKRARK